MYANTDLAEYMAEIRQHVCAHCIERPPGGPPCLPQGKRCGVEVNLRELVDSVHQGYSMWIDPYIERFHQGVCVHCVNRETPQCPCALEYLLELAIEAIEEVDARHSGNAMS